MALTQVDHFLIQTADLGKTRDWYVRALGMTEPAQQSLDVVEAEFDAELFEAEEIRDGIQERRGSRQGTGG